MAEGHKGQFSIHPGATKMYQDLKKNFWWPGMKKDVAVFVSKCLVCQKVKIEHQKPSGELQPLDVPQWKWESISMDFVVGLPKTQAGCDSIWVVVDRLTKSAHFLPVKVSFTTEQLAKLYVREIVRLHGVPESIISDRDPKFTSRFWEALQEAFGTQLRLSTAYHPQTDGQTERTIQTLEDMLRACTLEQGSAWDRYLPLVEFSYNNSFHASLGMAPYEALYGRRCRTPTCWSEVGDRELFGLDFVQDTTLQIQMIREKLKQAQNRQKSYYDVRHRPLEFSEGEHVFVRLSPVTGVGRALGVRKLSPRYIGPYQILGRVGPVAYRLALPPNLANIHDVLHVSQLRRYIADPSHVVQPDDVEVRENLKTPVGPLRILDRGEKQLRSKTIPMVKVQWTGRTPEECTWEREDELLRQYPEFHPGMFLDFGDKIPKKVG